MSDLDQTAIDAALSGNWEKAVEVNLELLEENNKDTASLNRLVRAYIELNEKVKADKYLKQVIKVDPYNLIAQKLKVRLENLSQKRKTPGDTQITRRQTQVSFIEEPGKTQTVSLINLATPRVISHLEYAQCVMLEPKHHSVHVCTQSDEYIGSLPDDIGKRLYLLIKGGNCYEACVKSSSNSIVTIFIHETCRCKKFRTIPSFAKADEQHHLELTHTSLNDTDENQKGKEEDEDEEDAHRNAKIMTIHQDEEPE